MANFRDLQDRINLDYLNRTDLGAETKRAIIRAIKHFEKNHFWFNQTATALAIGTASINVAVPADFLALDFATVVDSSIASIVTIRTYDRIAYRNQNQALSGVPVEVAYYRDQLYFTPKPSSATSLTIAYTHALPPLSADADSNGWTSAAEDLIVHHATADMLANVLRVTDVAQVQAHKTWEKEAYDQLKTGNDLRIGTNLDGAVTGANHGQKPKPPSAGLS